MKTLLISLLLLTGCSAPLSDHQILMYRCANAKVPRTERYEGIDNNSPRYDFALYECEKENPKQ